MYKIMQVVAGGGLSAMAVFALQVTLSHLLSVSDFGLYATMNAIIVCLIPFFSQGISGLFLRRSSVAECGSAGLSSKADYLFALVLSSMLGYALIALFALTQAASNLFEFLLLGTFIFSTSIQFFGIAQSQVGQRGADLLLCQSALPLLRLMLIMGLFFYSVVSLATVAFYLFLANCIAIFILVKRLNLPFSHFRGASFKLALDKIRQSFGYSINASVNVLQIQVAVLIVSSLYGVKAAAYYASAITIMNALLLIPSIVFANYFLHRYHRILAQSPKSLLPLRHALFSLFFGAVAGISLYYGYEQIFEFVYPSGYAGGVSGLMAALSLAVVIKYFSTAIGAALLSEGAVYLKVIVSILGLVLQILVSIVYRDSGYEFVAYGYVVGEVVVAIGYVFLFFRNREGGVA